MHLQGFVRMVSDKPWFQTVREMKDPSANTYSAPPPHINETLMKPRLPVCTPLEPHKHKFSRFADILYIFLEIGGCKILGEGRGRSGGGVGRTPTHYKHRGLNDIRCA